MRLAQILFTQGFGTRRVCAGIVAKGLVRIGGQVVDDPQAEVETAGLVFDVEGRPWPYAERALLMLHKPVGYECSQKPRHHPSVLSLLPQPLRTRGVQPVGRLDEDTTGLLLLTDDGTLIHRLTSPKWHVPKVYEVGTKHPVTDEEITRLLAGVVLDDDSGPGARRGLRAQQRLRVAADADGRQVPPGQAHGGGGGQPGGDPASQPLRRRGLAGGIAARAVAVAAGGPGVLNLDDAALRYPAIAGMRVTGQAAAPRGAAVVLKPKKRRATRAAAGTRGVARPDGKPHR